MGSSELFLRGASLTTGATQSTDWLAVRAQRADLVNISAELGWLPSEAMERN